MKYFVKVCVSVLLSVSSLAAAEVKQLRLMTDQALSGVTSNQVEILNATAVNGRILASVKVLPKDKKEMDSWMSNEKGTRFAAAWFTNEWKLVSIGEPLYGFEAFFNPVPSGISQAEMSTLPTGVFPMILVRDAASEKCPFAYVTATRLMCLNNELGVERGEDGSKHEWDLPVQANNFMVIDQTIWVASSYMGTLLHPFDFETGKLETGVLNSSALMSALKKAKVEDDRLKEFSAEDSPVVNDEEDSSQKVDASEQVKGLERAVLTTPRSFQFKVLKQKQNIYIFLRSPLAMVTLSWPELKVRNLFILQKDDLASFMLGYSQLWVSQFDMYQGRPMVWLSLLRPLTYGNLLTTSPDYAKGIHDRWDEAKKGPLTPEVVLGTDETQVALSLEGDRIDQIFVKDDQTFEKEWREMGAPFFHLNGNQVWASAINTDSHLVGLERVL